MDQVLLTNEQLLRAAETIYDLAGKQSAALILEIAQFPFDEYVSNKIKEAERIYIENSFDNIPVSYPETYNEIRG